MPKLPIGDISPCVIIWDYGGGVGKQMHIGPYLGTVSLRVTDSISDVHEEGYGDAPVDSIFAGTVYELDVPMARNTLDQLDHMLTYERDAAGNWKSSLGGVGNKVLTLKNMAGVDMYALAKQIVIAPTRNNVPDPDPNTWYLLYKCHPYREFELTWDRAGQRIHMVKFKVFPNQDSGYCGDYGTEGMESGSTPITGIC
ncbi:hypothetical protein ES703_01268 [subsurface metagenome]